MKPQKRKLKLTGWYSGVNPMRSRPGHYEVMLADGKPALMNWIGAKWCVGGLVMWQQDRTWRGLAR